MMKVAIVPVTTARGRKTFHAIAGTTYSSGNTAGAALDALTAQLPPDETSTLVIVQTQRPDAFFSASQQARLATLMAAWQQARDQGQELAASEQAELEALIDMELQAATQRAAALATDAGL